MSISELSNSGLANETGNGISNVLEMSGVDSNTIVIDTTVGNEPVESTPIIIDTTIPVEGTVSPTVERVEVDLASLPREEVERPGITVKRNIEEEILGAGGEFEQYLKEKEAERIKMFEEIDRHNEMVAMELNEDVPEEITDEIVEMSKEKLANKEVEDIMVDENVYDEEEEDTYIPTKVNPKSFDVSYKDFEEEDEVVIEDDSTDDVLSDEDNLKQLANSITEKIAPVSKKLDISTFSISNKPITANNALNNINKNAAEWVLLSTGSTISMSEFGGIEIQELFNASNNNNGLSDYTNKMKMFKIIWDHIVSEKPKTVDAFVKAVSFTDYDNLFMAMYIANFAGSNYIPVDCTGCHKAFLTDNIEIKDMYKYTDKKYNKLVEETLNKHNTAISDSYISEAVPISNTVAIGFKIPSIYNIFIESSLVEKEFVQRYSSTLQIISAIDTIYSIDMENKKLIPIDYQIVPTNLSKTYKNKIAAYSKILKSLSTDETNNMALFISKIFEDHQYISYNIPEVTCPHCGKVIPPVDISAEQLLFMRHQLTSLASTTKN